MNATARAVAASLLVAASILAATLTAAAARAHASRVSADPAENSALSAGPAWVSATFNEPLQTTFAAMTVVGPDAKIWSSGQPQVRGAVVGVAVRPLGPVGRYRVNYRVTSADGHVVSGSWSFSLTVPGGGTPGPPAGAGDTATHGIPVWPFFAGAAVLLACAGLWAVRRRA